MSDFRMPDAYPNTPAGFERRMAMALSHLRVPAPRRRMRPALVVAVAMIGALLISALAYAAVRSNLLDRLFPRSAPSLSAEKLVRPLGLTQSKDGFTMTVDEYLYDGEDLYIHWRLKSPHDRQLIVGGVRADASLPQLQYQGDYVDLYNEGVLLGGEWQGETLSQEMRFTTRLHDYQGDVSEPFDVTLEASVFKTDLPIERDTGMDDSLRGEHLVSEGERDGYQVVRLADYYLDGENRVANWLDIADRSERLAEFSFQLTITPDPINIVHTKTADGKMRFEFDEFKIEFSKIDFTAAGTDIRYVLTPTDASPMPEPNEEGISTFSIFFDLLVDGQKPVQHLNQQIDGSAGRCVRDGEIWGDAFSQPPKTMTFIPYYFKAETGGERVYLPDCGFTIALETASGQKRDRAE